MIVDEFLELGLAVAAAVCRAEAWKPNVKTETTKKNAPKQCNQFHFKIML